MANTSYSLWIYTPSTLSTHCSLHKTHPDHDFWRIGQAGRVPLHGLIEVLLQQSLIVNVVRGRRGQRVSHQRLSHGVSTRNRGEGTWIDRPRSPTARERVTCRALLRSVAEPCKQASPHQPPASADRSYRKHPLASAPRRTRRLGLASPAWAQGVACWTATGSGPVADLCHRMQARRELSVKGLPAVDPVVGVCRWVGLVIHVLDRWLSRSLDPGFERGGEVLWVLQ